MKWTLLFVTIFLLSCEKSAIQRDKRQLKGKWEMIRSWYNPDGPKISKRSNYGENWNIEFKDSNKFVFTDGTTVKKGNYRLAYTELHFDILNDSGVIQETWLWYDITISNRRLTVYNMQADGVYELFMKKVD